MGCGCGQKSAAVEVLPSLGHSAVSVVPCPERTPRSSERSTCSSFPPRRSRILAPEHPEDDNTQKQAAEAGASNAGERACGKGPLQEAASAAAAAGRSGEEQLEQTLLEARTHCGRTVTALLTPTPTLQAHTLLEEAGSSGIPLLEATICNYSRA